MLTGFLGPDWLRKHGVNGPISDEMLRGWRDHLELALRSELQLDADFAIGSRTQFIFSGGSETHTIIEIESFARRALDTFLNNYTSTGAIRKAPRLHP